MEYIKITEPRYAWVIDREYISMADSGLPIHGPKGLSDRQREALKVKGEAFEIKDCNGILYCSGRIIGDYEGFEPLDDFGTPSLGATDIFFDGKPL